MFRAAQPLGCRQRQGAAASGLQGARLHQRGLCVVDRQGRQPRHAGRRVASISPRCAARSICPSTPISRAALPMKPEKVAAQCRARGQDRRRRIVDRGFHRRCRQAALRARARDRAHQGGARGDRCRQQRRVADRPLRRFSGRAGRSGHGDRPAEAYAEAGADCLYAPGIKTREQIAAIVKAVHPEAGQSPDRRVRSFGRARPPILAFAASASAARWRGPRGPASCAPRARSPSRGPSRNSARDIPGGELNKMFG